MTVVSKVAAALLVGSAAGLLAAKPPPPTEGRVPEEKAPAQKEKAAAPKLEGTYTVVSGEKDGMPVPADRIKGSIVVFTSDKIVGTDKDKKEFFAANYTLDAAKTPWVIRMKSTSPKEAEAAGVVKKEGDTVTIAYGAPGGDAPTEFKTKENQHLFVLKATKKDDAPPPKP
jgi:uncharacterized protein (TIGR03067 family)